MYFEVLFSFSTVGVPCITWHAAQHASARRGGQLRYSLVDPNACNLIPLYTIVNTTKNSRVVQPARTFKREKTASKKRNPFAAIFLRFRSLRVGERAQSPRLNRSRKNRRLECIDFSRYMLSKHLTIKHSSTTLVRDNSIMWYILWIKRILSFSLVFFSFQERFDWRDWTLE